MSEKLVARLMLDEQVKYGVTCFRADRKRGQVSIGKLLARVFGEKLLDPESGKFPISRNELLAPLE